MDLSNLFSIFRPGKSSYSSSAPLPSSALMLRWCFATTVALYACVVFVAGGATAFEWPAIDMAPFFERSVDPSFVQQDFFTNASSEPSPRHLFGWLVLATAQVFGVSWYAVFFAVKVAVVMLTPFCLFWLLYSSALKRVGDGSPVMGAFASALAVIAAMWPGVAASVSVGWWQPFQMNASSHGLAIAVGLLSGCVWTSGRGTQAFWVGAALLLCSTLLHPISALVTYGFVMLTREWNDRRAEGIYLVLGLVLPLVAVAIWFRSGNPLITIEFIDIYVRLAHPQHYLVSEYLSLNGERWWIPMARIVGALSIVAFLAWARGQVRVLRFARLALIAYTGAILLQWIFVEVLPMKAVAVLGPARFSMYGYWLASLAVVLTFVENSRPLAKIKKYDERLLAIGFGAVLVSVLLLALGKSQIPEVWGRYSMQRAVYLAGAMSLAGLLLFPLLRFRGSLPDLGIGWFRRIALVGLAGWAAIAIGAFRDQPFASRRANHRALFDWVEGTPVDSVFAVFPSALVAEFPLIGRRAVFVGNGFPFVESQMRQHAARMEKIYGSVEARRKTGVLGKIDQTSAYFASLGPSEFASVAASDRLDYVVLDASRVSAAFDGQMPVYRDDRVAVYPLKKPNEAFD